MRTKVLLVAICLGLTASTALASDVNFGLNLNIGNSPPPVQAPIVVEEPPQFIVPQGLGFYVAVGIPYDMFYISNRYYVYRANRWYYGPSYNGPWHVTSYRYLPGELHRHRIDQIRHYRDEEYRVYTRDRDHYRGRHYRPEFVGRDRRGGHEGREMEHRHGGRERGDR